MAEKYKIRNPGSAYFITFATVEWIDVFTRPCYKQIVVESLNHAIQNKGLIVHAWVIMSNHLHLAVASDKVPLQDILRDFKKYTAKAIVREIRENPKESRREWLLRHFEHAGQLNKHNTYIQFWQQELHAIELYEEKQIANIIHYIHENPVRAGFVNEAHHYPHSSAVDYAGEKGLVRNIVPVL